jgi:hypothetical protein
VITNEIRKMRNEQELIAFFMTWLKLMNEHWEGQTMKDWENDFAERTKMRK